MDHKRKTAKVTVEGIGDVRLRKPSPLCAIRINRLFADCPDSPDGALTPAQYERNARVRCETIADCLVDESGARVFASADDVLENIDPNRLIPIYRAIEALPSSVPIPGEPEKNSGSAPTSCSASTSQES